MAQAKGIHSPSVVEYSYLSDETLREQIANLRLSINFDEPRLFLPQIEEVSMRLEALHQPTENEKYSRGVIFDDLSAGYFAKYQNTNELAALENSFKYCQLALRAYAAVADSPLVGERAIAAANQFIIHSEERYQNASLNEYVARLSKEVAEINAVFEQKMVAAEAKVIKERAIAEKILRDQKSAAASRTANSPAQGTGEDKTPAKMEEEWGSGPNGEEDGDWDEKSKYAQEQQAKEDEVAAEKQKDEAWNFEYKRSPFGRINPATTGLSLSPIALPQNSASSAAFSATVMSLADSSKQGSSAASVSLSSGEIQDSAAMHVESSAPLSHAAAESSAKVTAASARQEDASQFATGSNSSENAMDTGENSSDMTSTFAAASQQPGAAVAGSLFHLTPPPPIGRLEPLPSLGNMTPNLASHNRQKKEEDENDEDKDKEHRKSPRG